MSFTLMQIENAYKKVKTGADFPKYIQEIKDIGVLSFTTLVRNSSTIYNGMNNFQTASEPKYEDLIISEKSNTEKFISQLKAHQMGQTDYFTFCNDCAANGIEKWIVRLDEMTCTYYDKNQNEILIEQIPSN